MGDVDQLRLSLTLVEGRWRKAVAERDAATQDLASANEELRALNDQLRALNGDVADRNRELWRLNDQLTSLLASTSIPVVMVDRELNIRCMTATAEYPFNLCAADVGRRITDIPSRLGLDLERVIRQVIDTAAAAETELLDNDGWWHLLRVRPYRIGSRVAGATLTLVDIDHLYRHRFTESIVEFVPTPVLVLNSRLRVRAANRSFLSFYGLRAAEVESGTLCDIAGGRFRSIQLEGALDRLARGETESEEIECSQSAPEGERTLLITIRCVRQAGDHQFVLAIHDTTEQNRHRKNMALALHLTEDALRLSHEDLQALTGRLLHAQDEERRRVSRELHDDLSQNVAKLQFDVEALARALPEELETERNSLSTIENSVAQLSNELRRIAYGLHPVSLDVLGLTTSLEVYVRDFSQRMGMQVDFTTSGVPADIPPGIVSSLYRIAQEALRNIARHAGRQAAEIRLTGDDSMLTLSIRDRGPGFDREAVRGKGGLGLVSMEERARLVRARFQLDTAPGKGVWITVTAPLG